MIFDKKCQNLKKVLLHLLNLIYFVFSFACASLTFVSYGEIVFHVGFYLQLLQTVVPAFIAFYLGVDYVTRCKKLQNECSHSQNASSKILAFLSVLFVIRTWKLIMIWSSLSFTLYMMSSMIPELVMSMNDFVFAFYVEDLTNQINELSKSLKLKPMTLERVQSIEKTISQVGK